MSESETAAPEGKGSAVWQILVRSPALVFLILSNLVWTGVFIWQEGKLQKDRLRIVATESVEKKPVGVGKHLTNLSHEVASPQEMREASAKLD